MFPRMAAAMLLSLVMIAPATVARAQGNNWSPVMESDSLDVNLNTALDIALSESPSVKVAGKEILRKEYASKETR